MRTFALNARLASTLSIALILNTVMASLDLTTMSCLALSSAGAKAGTRSLSKDELSRRNFSALVDDFYDGMFRMLPHHATEAGIHDYDGMIPDMSSDGIRKLERFFENSLKKIDAIDGALLSEDQKIDRVLLISQIKGSLLDLSSISKWRKDPDEYSSLACSVVFSLMKRDFAPLADRLKSTIEREKAIPAMLKQGKKNLVAVQVPRIYAEIALEQMPGIVSFFETDVPLAFESVKDDTLKQEFRAANKDVISALKDYAVFVEKEILPNARGNFAIGPDTYQKKLLYDELVDEPLDRLLQKGYQELRRLQKEFAKTAHAIDPNSSSLRVFESISTNHPKSDEVIDSVKKCLEDLRAFCKNQSIVGIPSEERATVAETPPFLRALSFASMDTPGPFEKKAKEAYYHVTLPEKSWPARRVEEHLRTFSYPDILNTSVHEAYPGHYVQFLWVNENPSKVRKLYSCGSNCEGWAHYCEQMMVDEGLGKGNLNLRLVQLHDALLRCCRYIVGIRMHTDKMTVQEATNFFIREGLQERANAEREAKRGTSDPTYLVYTLGKLQILALREDYKKKAGDSFTLKEFHDKFLSLGCPPVKVARLSMLGGTAASLKISAKPDAGRVR